MAEDLRYTDFVSDCLTRNERTRKASDRILYLGPFLLTAQTSAGDLGFRASPGPRHIAGRWLVLGSRQKMSIALNR
jgi:hypothetical protein